MDIVNIMSTTNKINGIPYWIINGKKDENGQLMTVYFIYSDKQYEIELEESERPTAPFSAVKMAKLQHLVLRKMRPYLENHS